MSIVAFWTFSHLFAFVAWRAKADATVCCVVVVSAAYAYAVNAWLLASGEPLALLSAGGVACTTTVTVAAWSLGAPLRAFPPLAAEDLLERVEKCGAWLSPVLPSHPSATWQILPVAN